MLHALVLVHTPVADVLYFLHILFLVNPPGNVQELLVRVVPGSNGTQAQISWLPPTDLGSEGHVYYYMIFYGPVDDMRLSFQPGTSVFNQTVSGVSSFFNQMVWGE